MIRDGLHCRSGVQRGRTLLCPLSVIFQGGHDRIRIAHFTGFNDVYRVLAQGLNRPVFERSTSRPTSRCRMMHRSGVCTYSTA